jgi:hypothetical protein
MVENIKWLFQWYPLKQKAYHEFLQAEIQVIIATKSTAHRMRPPEKYNLRNMTEEG